MRERTQVKKLQLINMLLHQIFSIFKNFNSKFNCPSNILNLFQQYQFKNDYGFDILLKLKIQDYKFQLKQASKQLKLKTSRPLYHRFKHLMQKQKQNSICLQSNHRQTYNKSNKYYKTNYKNNDIRLLEQQFHDLQISGNHKNKYYRNQFQYSREQQESKRNYKRKNYVQKDKKQQKINYVAVQQKQKKKYKEKIKEVQVKNQIKKEQLKEQKSIKKQQEQQEKINQSALNQAYLKLHQSKCQIHSKIYDFVQNKTLNSKQTKSKTDNAQNRISLKQYKKIQQIWSQKTLFNRQTKKITNVIKFTNQILMKLKPKHWLNDEIVNSYIQLIQLDIINKYFVKENNSKLKNQLHVNLMTSWITGANLQKRGIERQIQKRNISQQSLVILPICQDSHWFFIIFYQRTIYVFDSLLPKLQSPIAKSTAKKQYCLKKSVHNCLNFYQQIYNVKQISSNLMKIVKQFPQQNNSNDCGMMMLEGIKNVILICRDVVKNGKIMDTNIFYQRLKDRNNWNFCIEEIGYLRHVYVKQLLDEKIEVREQQQQKSK